jgi:hypothetical protein
MRDSNENFALRSLFRCSTGSWGWGTSEDGMLHHADGDQGRGDRFRMSFMLPIFSNSGQLKVAEPSASPRERHTTYTNRRGSFTGVGRRIGASISERRGAAADRERERKYGRRRDSRVLSREPQTKLDAPDDRLEPRKQLDCCAGLL